MEAVRRELVRRDIATEVAAGHALGHQVPDQDVKLLLRLGDPLVLVKECGELGAVVPTGPA